MPEPSNPKSTILQEAQPDVGAPLLALVQLLARQAARDWLLAAHPHDPTQETGDER